MTRAEILARGSRWTVALDDRVDDSRRHQALVQARIIDELTREPVTTPAEIEPAGDGLSSTAARQLVRVRQAEGGLAGLVGIPLEVFPHADLVTYEVGLHVQASGYVPHDAIQLHGPVPSMPDTFGVADLGDLELHREPVILHGRTVWNNAGSIEARPNANVRLIGVWYRIPPATAVVLPDPPHVVSLHPPIYAGRPAPAATVRNIGLSPVAGENKTLALPVRAGDTRLRISDRVNLNPGHLVRIDEEDPALTENIPVATVEGATDPENSATVTLEHPLAFCHRNGVTVRRVTPFAPGAFARALDREAIRGDTCAVLDNAAGLGPTVMITGGGPAAEYHQASVFDTSSDADGYFRLPPLSRVAQVRIHVSSPTLQTIERDISLEFGATEQRVDFVLMAP